MKKTCPSPPGNRTRIRAIKAGSKHLKIYSATLKKRPIHTVYWRVGEKPYRKLFADLKKAGDFAKAQAEQLAAGQVHAPAISITDAQTCREAQRRLGPADVPPHVVADEYADILQQLGDNGTVRQAIEFFLHNAVRPDLIRTVSQVVGEFIAAKSADGLSKAYLEDCGWRLRRFAADFQMAISHVCTRDIEEWLRQLSVGLATRNDFRRLIITLFNFARRRGYLPRDRATEARWLEKPKIKSKPLPRHSRDSIRERDRIALCASPNDGDRNVAAPWAAIRMEGVRIRECRLADSRITGARLDGIRVELPAWDAATEQHWRTPA